MSKKKVRVPLTDLQKRIVASLDCVTFLPGHGDKRFYKSIRNDLLLTEKQIQFLYKVFDKYRRQIPNYSELAMELKPERFKVDIQFDNTLFGVETKVDIKDTYTPKQRWTKKDRENNSQ